jgi:twitching motility protein PilT
LPRRSGKGRVAAFEVMLSSPAIRNHIREAKTFQIPSVLQTGKKYGMQTMDDAIFDLYSRGDVSADTALLFAQDRGALSNRLI